MSIILEIEEADPDPLGTLAFVINEARDDVWVVLPKAEDIHGILACKFGLTEEQASITSMAEALGLEAKLKAKGFKLTLREEGSTEDLLQKWREKVASQ